MVLDGFELDVYFLNLFLLLLFKCSWYVASLKSVQKGPNASDLSILCIPMLPIAWLHFSPYFLLTIFHYCSFIIYCAPGFLGRHCFYLGIQALLCRQRSPTHRQRASPSELMGIGYVIRAEPTCPSVPVCSGVRIDADAYPCRFPWIPCFRGGVRVPDHSSSRPRANVRCSIQSPAPERPSTKSKR